MRKEQILKLGITLLLLSIAFILIAGKGCPWKTDKDEDIIITGSSLPGAVASGTPANGATNIPITSTLTWATVSGASSYDVYFGTTNPPPYVTNTALTIYNPSTLTYSTTYYWRIDSCNSWVKIIGTVWSFQALTVWAEIKAGAYHTIAYKSNGTLWAWGLNDRGQLGLGDTISRSTPTQIGSDKNWDLVVCGHEHSLARKTDGTLWAWGHNEYGQLGLGYTNASCITPTQVVTDTDWAEVVANIAYHTVARKNDGTIWVWGRNDYGELGLGHTTTPISSPTQVVTDTIWAEVYCGHHHTIARTVTGTLWSWGLNDVGELGLGYSSVSCTTPTQIGTDTDWVTAGCGGYHTAAIKDDGTLWVCGFNNYAQLGLGGSDVNPHPNLVKVGTDENWIAVVCGNYQTLALKNNGTLWGWGRNDLGQLGVGDENQRISPTKIGTDSNWAGFSTIWHTVAIKINRTIWTWGENNYGELGLGDYTNRNTPTQVSQ